jgi:hypothetical protein
METKFVSRTRRQTAQLFVSYDDNDLDCERLKYVNIHHLLQERSRPLPTQCIYESLTILVINSYELTLIR